MGKHSPDYVARQLAMQLGRWPTEVVDASLTAHTVPEEACVVGRSEGRYVAICGEKILPAALVAKQARYCSLCIPIPAQRFAR